MIIMHGGFQSLGKTSSVLQLAGALKAQHQSVNIWTDMPRRCPLKINEDGGTLTQWWIISAMIKETLELNNIYSWVISDRSPLDSVVYENTVYTLRNGVPSPHAGPMLTFIMDWLVAMKIHIFWVVKGYPFLMEKGRSEHSEFKELSAHFFDEIREELKKYHIPVEEIDVTKLNYMQIAKDLITSRPI